MTDVVFTVDNIDSLPSLAKTDFPVRVTHHENKDSRFMFEDLS